MSSDRLDSEEPFDGCKLLLDRGKTGASLRGIHVIGPGTPFLIEGRELDLRVGPKTLVRNLHFRNCQLRVHDECRFEGCEFLDGTDLRSVVGQKLVLDKGCLIRKSTVTDIVSINDSLVEESTLQLDGQQYRNTSFQDCVLGHVKTDCKRVEFSNVRFSGGEFVYPRFNHCSFTGCTFWNVQFLASTFFDACRFRACKMSRWTWFTIPANAGLTIANKVEINVSDPIENMRRNFTGINSVLHWIFLGLFLAPYAMFIAWQWGKHLVAPGLGSESLIMQLAKYIASGGATNREWNPNWYSLAIFALYVSYNVARAALLWKMMQIETEQRIKGVPSKMELVGSRVWRRIESVLHIAKWIMIPLVVWNTIIFLLTKTPY